MCTYGGLFFTILARTGFGRVRESHIVTRKPITTPFDRRESAIKFPSLQQQQQQQQQWKQMTKLNDQHYTGHFGAA